MVDLGLLQLKSSPIEKKVGGRLENIVYNELIARGYDVYIGKTDNGEIDFVVDNFGERFYIQVADYLSSEEVIEYMATNLGSDIRQLEGAVTRLVAYSTIMGSEITLNLAIEALKDYVSKGISDKNDVNKIQRIVAEYFQISVEDLKSKKRNSNISFPRQIAMYLCRKLTDESFPKIGIEFGGKDHSTVMHSCEKIEREIKINKDLAKTIDDLTKEIQRRNKYENKN